MAIFLQNYKGFAWLSRNSKLEMISLISNLTMLPANVYLSKINDVNDVFWCFYS